MSIYSFQATTQHPLLNLGTLKHYCELPGNFLRSWFSRIISELVGRSPLYASAELTAKYL